MLVVLDGMVVATKVAIEVPWQARGQRYRRSSVSCRRLDVKTHAKARGGSRKKKGGLSQSSSQKTQRPEQSSVQIEPEDKVWSFRLRARWCWGRHLGSLAPFGWSTVCF